MGWGGNWDIVGGVHSNQSITTIRGKTTRNIKLWSVGKGCEVKKGGKGKKGER